MQFNEYLSQGRFIPFERVRPMQKVLVVRNARDGHARSYVGVVKQLRKPNAYVIDMTASVFFEDGIQSSRFKEKEVSFRNSSDIRVYLLESVDANTKQNLAEERKAYAKARRALQQARSVESEYFTLLGIDSSITPEEFRAVKRKLMVKWHPDKAAFSTLSESEFLQKSKKYMDALSWVSEYLSSKSKRVQS